jgi:hypothetical protein
LLLPLLLSLAHETHTLKFRLPTNDGGGQGAGNNEDDEHTSDDASGDNDARALIAHRRTVARMATFIMTTVTLMTSVMSIMVKPMS